MSDHETGILVLPGNVDELAESIRRICQDKELAARLGRRAWEIARTRFTEERLIEALLESVGICPS